MLMQAFIEFLLSLFWGPIHERS